MFELTLLERIEDLESNKSKAGKTPVEIETQSILTNLSKILNTNRGSVQIAHDFGMPDITTYSSDEITSIMEKIAKAVLELVKKYEKRLTKVKVTIESGKSNVLAIYFTLEGVLARHDNVPILFHSMVKPGGSISVQ